MNLRQLVVLDAGVNGCDKRSGKPDIIYQIEQPCEEKPYLVMVLHILLSCVIYIHMCSPQVDCQVQPENLEWVGVVSEEVGEQGDCKS